MTSFFDLYLYAKAGATEHPIIAAVLFLVSAVFLLPPVALAGFLASPVLLPVALLLLVSRFSVLLYAQDGAASTTDHTVQRNRRCILTDKKTASDKAC